MRAKKLHTQPIQTNYLRFAASEAIFLWWWWCADEESCLTTTTVVSGALSAEHADKTTAPKIKAANIFFILQKPF